MGAGCGLVGRTGRRLGTVRTAGDSGRSPGLGRTGGRRGTLRAAGRTPGWSCGGVAGRTRLRHARVGVARRRPESAGAPRRRALWVSLAAVLALAGVATAAVLYLTRDRYPALEFRTVDQLTRVPAGTERPADMFTAVLGQRAYLGYPLGDGRLEVVAVDAGTGAVKWRKQTAVSSDRWKGIVALPGAVAVFADAIGDDTPGTSCCSTAPPATSGGAGRSWATTT